MRKFNVKLNQTFNYRRRYINVVYVKKNDELKFCVNYKNLNVVIIKNKMFLSLIDETLNRLIKIVYFIKLNFKNVYYRIKIKIKNE